MGIVVNKLVVGQQEQPKPTTPAPQPIPTASAVPQGPKLAVGKLVVINNGNSNPDITSTVTVIENKKQPVPTIRHNDPVLISVTKPRIIVKTTAAVAKHPDYVEKPSDYVSHMFRPQK